MAERPTVMSWSEKSAEAVVAAGLGRRVERVGGPTAMSLGGAVHQKPGQPGRKAGGQGEAKPSPKRCVMKHGRRDMKLKAQGETACSCRRSRARTW